MPSITIKMPETAVKTTGVKPFDGFKNKEGYQALAEGVSAAGAQLKDILIKRQQIINAVIQEEYNTESQRIVNDFMARQKAEAERKGVPLSAEAMQKSEPFLLEELTTGTKHITEKGHGDFRRRMEAMPAQTVKNLSPELNRLDYQKQDTRTKYSVETDVIPYIQKGDMKTAEEKLSYYVKIGAISEADKARILAEAPHTQAAYHGQQMQSVSAGTLYTALKENDPRLAGFNEEEREALLATASTARMDAQQKLCTAIMDARGGISSGEIMSKAEKALADKTITQAQFDAFKRNEYGAFFTEMVREDPDGFSFLTPEEKALAAAGDPRAFDRFKDGGEVIRLMTSEPSKAATDPDSEQHLRMMLKLSGVDASYADYYIQNITKPKRTNSLSMENTNWFRRARSRRPRRSWRRMSPKTSSRKPTPTNW